MTLSMTNTKTTATVICGPKSKCLEGSLTGMSHLSKMRTVASPLEPITSTASHCLSSQYQPDVSSSDASLESSQKIIGYPSGYILPGMLMVEFAGPQQSRTVSNSHPIPPPACILLFDIWKASQQCWSSQLNPTLISPCPSTQVCGVLSSRILPVQFWLVSKSRSSSLYCFGGLGLLSQ